MAVPLIDASPIPLLLSGDLEGGAIALPFGTQLPNQLGLAATGSADLARIFRHHSAHRAHARDAWA